MFIYLASRFSRIGEMNEYRTILEGDGHIITSRWLGEPESGEGDDHNMTLHPEMAQKFATDDVEDIAASDVLMVFTDPPRDRPKRGGMHVEFGYALGLGKEIVAVGPVENVFYTLPSVHRFDTFGWARLYINQKEKTWSAVRGLMSPMGVHPASTRAMDTIRLSSSPEAETGTTPRP